jgi:hypothetical protein
MNNKKSKKHCNTTLEFDLTLNTKNIFCGSH